jgi:guanylate kinase
MSNAPSAHQMNKAYGLIVVAAPSGAGKSTLCAELLKNNPARISLSISCTSRAPRGTEVNGKEYFFLTREVFEQKIKDGVFAEWAEVHGNYYGTSRETLEHFWNQKKHVLLDIDVQGAESMRKAFPDQCFTVFIAPPDLAELERRLRGRGTETEAAIQKRMANARFEMDHQEKFDCTLVNDDFNKTLKSLETEVTSFMDQLEGGTWQKLP